jgi:hypothetical protein
MREGCFQINTFFAQSKLSICLCLAVSNLSKVGLISLESISHAPIFGSFLLQVNNQNVWGSDPQTYKYYATKA